MTATDNFASSRFRGKSPALQFGVMCSGTIFQRWQADAISELRSHGHQLNLLIVDARHEAKTSRLKRLVNKPRATLLFSLLENRMFKPPAKKMTDLTSVLQGIAMLTCQVVKNGYSEYFNETDLEIIRNHKLDFILRFGFNIIRGEILSVARHGIWSFHHDDELKYRGGPPGFWEIFRHDPVSGAIMQRLTDRLDGGIILKKGYLKTVLHSYRENLEQLLTVSSTWPARVANELSESEAEPGANTQSGQIRESNTTAKVYHVPGNFQMLRFIFMLLRNRTSFYYRDLFAAEFWNVGLIRKPVWEVALGNATLRDDEITWLPQPRRSGYLADPAGFIEDGQLHVLAEDYSYVSRKAMISEIVLHPDRVWHPDRVLGGTIHLSYPFVFENDDTIYCIPESYLSSKITLYRRDKIEKKFVPDRILVADVHAVDPTMVFFFGYWWLFYTDKRYSNTHLYLYYANELTGEFKPHRNNPVKIDIRSARPAGTPFIKDGVLYRPAQDCSVTYGGRVALNRVLHISPDDFLEETVNFIEPVKESRYNKGLHTISGVGNYTLIDGKRYCLNRHFFIHQLRKKLIRKGAANV